ncbi:MAG: DUF4230 domain-containing protein [bacterium]
MQHQSEAYKNATISKTLTLLTQTKILQTASIDIKKEITGQQNLSHFIPGIGVDDLVNSSLFGGNMTLDMEGRVNAGLRLEGLSTGNISIQNGSVVLQIPAPQVLGTQVIESRRLAPALSLTQADKLLEQQLKTKIQESILADALSSGLIDQAKQNTLATLQKLLSRINIKLKSVSFTQ